MPRFEDRLFTDTGDHLDRFGLLFILVVASVTLNSVVDISDPTSTFAGEIAWIGTSIIVGATLVVAMRSSGVARRPLRYATIGVGLVVLSAIVVSIVSSSDTVNPNAGRPSVLWVFLAAVTPVFVTRRLFLQKRVTAGTIFGAMAVFLLAALAFDYIFLTLDEWAGPVFGAPEPTTSFMYFSLVTITTLGYGDLSPTTEWSRYFATAEAVIGTVFLVTVVARLMSLYGKEPPLVGTALRPGGAGTDEREDSHESGNP